MLLLPLESLRFFEAAARHQGFARAAEELDVTPAAVAHRVRMLEKHLEVPLFDRRRRGVRLNRRGRAYLKEVQRVLAEVHGVSERERRWPRRVRIVSVEAVAGEESKGTLLTYWNNFVPASEPCPAENERSTFRQARLNSPGSQHTRSHYAVSSP